MITAFHSLSFVNGKKPLQIVKKADGVTKGFQLCVADRPISTVGVIVSGFHIATFSCDVWSKVDQDGMRFAEAVPEKTGELSQDEYEGLTALTLVEKTKYWEKAPLRHYCESWIEGQFVQAVYVKEHANAKEFKAARIVARKFGVQVIEVSPLTRIWDITAKIPCVFRFAS